VVSDLGSPSQCSAELSRRVEKVVGYCPLSEYGPSYSSTSRFKPPVSVQLAKSPRTMLHDTGLMPASRKPAEDAPRLVPVEADDRHPANLASTCHSENAATRWLNEFAGMGGTGAGASIGDS